MRVRRAAGIAAALVVFAAPSAHASAGLVKNINHHDPAGSSPREFTPLGSKMFFVADDGVHGDELWKSNGVRKRTKLVRDLNLGSEPSAPADLAVFGSAILFRATDGEFGHEIWKTDGTSAGTVRVTDINPDGDSTPSLFGVDETTEIVVAGAYAYFAAKDGNGDVELWRTDGTAANTTRVADINTSGSSNPSQLTAVGSTLFFRADDGTHGQELFKYDGSALTLIDIRPGDTPPNDSVPRSLEVLGSKLFFSAGDGTNGRELWVLDTSGNGTPELIDVRSGSTGSDPKEITAMGDAVYFSANGDLNLGTVPLTTSGVELWKSGGTSASTKVVLFIGAGAGSSPQFLTAAGSLLFLRATDQDGDVELWRSDGVSRYDLAEGDQIAAHAFKLNINAEASSSPFALAAIGTRLFLTADDGIDGPEPWKSDGTPEGTKRVADVDRGPEGGGGSTYALLGSSKVFFDGDDGRHGRELWRTSL